MRRPKGQSRYIPEVPKSPRAPVAYKLVITFFTTKNRDRFFYRPTQWRKVFLDDLPDDRGINSVVIMPQDIPDRANVGPWLFGSDDIHDAFEFSGRFGGAQKTARSTASWHLEPPQKRSKV
jgi:hypothetical protein